MPSNSIRVGGAHVAFSADTGQYDAALVRMRAQNARMASSYDGLSVAANRFNASLQSSLVATAAYVAGVTALNLAVGGSARVFIEHEKAMTEIAKTANLTERQAANLSRRFDELATSTSTLGVALPIARRELLEIGTAAGTLGIQGVANLAKFTEAVAFLGITTDLSGVGAARALGRLIANTSATPAHTLGLVSGITALGQDTAGGETGILNQARELAIAVSSYNVTAQELLGIAATLENVGIQPELARTAFSRTMAELIEAFNKSASGDVSDLRTIAALLDEKYGNIEERIALLHGHIEKREDFKAFKLFVEAYRNAGPTGQGQLLDKFFGGDPQRIRLFLNAMAKGFDTLTRNVAVAKEEFTSLNAVMVEVEKRSEDAGARLIVVGNRISVMATEAGAFLVSAFLPVAENFDRVAIGAAGLATAVGGISSARRVTELGKFNRERAKGLKYDAADSKQKAEAARKENLAAKRTSLRLAREARARRLLLQTQRAHTAQIAVAAAAETRLAGIRAASTAAAKREAVQRAQLGPVFTRLAGSSLVNEPLRARLVREEAQARKEAVRAQATVERSQARVASFTALGGGKTPSAAQARKASKTLERTTLAAANAAGRHAAAQKALNASLRIGTRVATAFAAVMAFTGGPIGLVIVGVTALTVFLANFGEELFKRTKTLHDFNDEALRGFEIADKNRGKTPESIAKSELDQSIETINANLVALRAARRANDQLLPANYDPDAPPRLFESPMIAANRMIDLQIEREEKGLETRKGINARKKKEAEDAAKVVEDTFLRVAVAEAKILKSLNTPGQQSTALRRQLDERLDAAIRASELAQSLTNASPQEKLIGQDIDRETSAIEKFYSTLRREIAKTEKEIETGKAAINDLLRYRNPVPPEDENRLRNLVEKGQDKLAAQRLELAAALADPNFVVNVEKITAAAGALLAAQIALAKARLPVPVEADVDGSRRGVLEGLEQSQAALKYNIRLREQEATAAKESLVVHAGLLAGYAVSNDYLDKLTAALRNQKKSEDDLNRAREDRLRLSFGIDKAADDEKLSLYEQAHALDDLIEKLIARKKEHGATVSAIKAEAGAYDDLESKATEAAIKQAKRARAKVIAAKELVLSTALARRATPVEADVDGPRRDVQDRLAETHRGLEDTIRLRRQDAEVAAASSQREADGIEATNIIRNLYQDQLREATSSQTDVQEKLNVAMENHQRLTFALDKASGDVLLKLIDHRDAAADLVETLKAEGVEITATQGELLKLAVAYALAAEKAGALARASFVPPVLIRKPVQVRADLAGAGRNADQAFAKAERGTVVSIRGAQQAAEIRAATSKAEAAELSARFNVLNTFEDERFIAATNEKKGVDDLNVALENRARIAGELLGATGKHLERLHEESNANAQFIVTQQARNRELSTESSILEGQLGARTKLADEQGRAARDNAAADRAERLSALLTRKPTPALADLGGARRRAQDDLIQVQRSVKDNIRLFGQEAEAAKASSDIQAAGFLARKAILNNYSDRLRDAVSVQLEGAARLADARAEQLRISAQLDVAADKDIDDLLRQRNAVAQLIVNQVALNAENLEYLETLRKLAPAHADVAAASAAQAEKAAESAKAAARPLQVIIDETKTFGEALEQSAANGAQRFGDELADLAVTGQANFSQLAESVVSDLIRMGIQMTVTANLAKVLQAVLGIAGAAFGGGGTAAPGGGGGSFSGSSGGGIAYHTGGIAQDATNLGRREVYAVLERGEEVLTRADPRHRWNVRGSSPQEISNWVNQLPRFHSGGVVGGDGMSRAGGGKLRVELINQGPPLEAVDNGQRFDVDGMVASVIIRDVRKDGPITQAIRGGR